MPTLYEELLYKNVFFDDFKNHFFKEFEKILLYIDE